MKTFCRPLGYIGSPDREHKRHYTFCQLASRQTAAATLFSGAATAEHTARFVHECRASAQKFRKGGGQREVGT